ncbi:hydroxyacylglutathione hydrolase [Candidatus Schneideria nysicola]|uniref:hydroxyacylglutathione hydrolase n=1 Tax=Candidatus Schneideria nysicola TaxID=1081631 RepID=UPI001CAA43BA|nr:hydroxyacylglutathione hydrolase [Candidatus Schneideria nysicola]UAJ65478.1 hydroxyacylglutathione hydrolase [Candidatus Schneideria nysicola]UAJ66007.1 hydroxyacylglutathione hydrolase [Candidatus Schneideria nysicola]
MNIVKIPALKDNYIWILYNKGKGLVIDPGDASPVFYILDKLHLTLIGILLTHYHTDHVGGIDRLKKAFPDIPVYGSYETRHTGATRIVQDGNIIRIMDHSFKVMHLPGHTLGHIGFFCDKEKWLFCGDTLFTAGCGKILEGTPQTMYNSIIKINSLPLDTLICSSHEYTLQNLKFARTLLPEDNILLSFEKKVKKILNHSKILPTTKLFLERKINVFLRCNDIEIYKKIGINYTNIIQPIHIFTHLRKMKDTFVIFLFTYSIFIF